MDRLLRKWHTAKKHVPKPVITGETGAKGRHHRLRHHAPRPGGGNARSRYMKDAKIKYTAPARSIPSSPEVMRDFIKSCDTVYVIEQNRDGQMKQLLEVDLPGNQSKLRSVQILCEGFRSPADIVERELKNSIGSGK